MWYKNVAGRFFGLVTKHACDRRTDRQNYDSQDRAGIAASRGKKVLSVLSSSHVACCVKPGKTGVTDARSRTMLRCRREAAVVTGPTGPAVRTGDTQRAVVLPTVYDVQHQPAQARSVPPSLPLSVRVSAC